jgi:transcriptional regulator with XRE-family HTH domain
MTTLKKIGSKIRTLRVKKGFTQENFAHELEMSHSGYAKIERGEVDINISRLEQIAEKLEVNLEEIVQINDVKTFNNNGTCSAFGFNATVNFQLSKEEIESIKKKLKE